MCVVGFEFDGMYGVFLLVGLVVDLVDCVLDCCEWCIYLLGCWKLVFCYVVFGMCVRNVDGVLLGCEEMFGKCDVDFYVVECYGFEWCVVIVCVVDDF